MNILLRYSKPDQYVKGVTIKLLRLGTTVCPFDNMVNVMTIRLTVSGPLLCHSNGLPLTRYHFSALSKTMRLINENYDKYKAHSFRIRAATTAANMSHSIESI